MNALCRVLFDVEAEYGGKAQCAHDTQRVLAEADVGNTDAPNAFVF